MSRMKKHRSRPLHEHMSLSLILTLLLLFVFAKMPKAINAAAGDLDPTFGVGGKVTTDLSPNQFGTSDNANAVALQHDGKIVVAGFFSGLGIGGPAFVRYNADGSLDSGFGVGGKAKPPFTGGMAAVLLQTDGRIVGVGSGFLNGQNGFLVSRLETDGTVDTSFGINGQVVTDFGRVTLGLGAALQSDGKIVVVGAVGVDNAIDFAIARYNSDGSLDATFGVGGKVVTDFQNHFDVARAVALQNDGKILVAGVSTNYSVPPFTGEDFGVARYNTDGTLDVTFGMGGKVTTDFGSVGDEAFAIRIQPDQKIILGGAGDPSPFNHTDFALARYNPNGSLDQSFGSGGKVTSDFASPFNRAGAIVLQQNGKIVAIGFTTGGAPTGAFGLIRYGADGAVDTSFGVNGRITTTFPIGGFPHATAGTIQPDGRIIAVGHYQNFTRGEDFALARYFGDPTDSTFDLCLQDDSSGNRVRLSSITGDYEFSDCTGMRLAGAGTSMRKGGVVTLQHYAADRRVIIRVDSSVNRGTATLQLVSQPTTVTIVDRNVANSLCTCSAQ
jgi:uncharacterized delta-60 repeat protein